MGNRLEFFFAYLIEFSKKYTLLEKNIQINNKKRTIGELDFIVKNDETCEIIHVELAGKIYLYDTEISGELARWVGPNRKDSLLNKVKKLKEIQFPLLYLKETSKYLKNYAIPDITQYVCFKARLFIPIENKGHIPAFINLKNIKGYYYKYDRFKKQNHNDKRYFLPEKQDWIIPASECEIWYDYNKIEKKIIDALTRGQSPMIWVKDERRQAYESIFVVWW